MVQKGPRHLACAELLLGVAVLGVGRLWMDGLEMTKKKVNSERHLFESGEKEASVGRELRDEARFDGFDDDSGKAGDPLLVPRRLGMMCQACSRFDNS